MLLKTSQGGLIGNLAACRKRGDTGRGTMGSYSIIIYANEYGQPKGQDLDDGDPVSSSDLIESELQMTVSLK
jgi:hypothetical protein